MFARYVRVLGACALSAMAIGAFASAAQAATGPEWIVGASKTALSGESVVTGTAVTPTLIGASGVLEVECALGDSTGAIIGGNPGRDTGKITFFSCHKVGAPTCLVGDSIGGSTITTKELASLLVYPEAGTASALNAFYPKSGTEFTTLNFANVTACGAFQAKKVVVSAGGTAAAETVGPVTAGQKCGALAQVGEEVSGAFKLTASGTVAALGGLNTTKPATEKGSLRTSGTTAAITCELLTGGEKSAFVANFSQKLLQPANEVFGWK